MDLLCVEFFSGTSRLTAAIRQLGFGDSFGVDHAISSRLVAPVVQLDLPDEHNFLFLQSIIQEPGCTCISHHIVAREVEHVSSSVKEDYNLPILRTD